jgi:hypothetical protein
VTLQSTQRTNARPGRWHDPEQLDCVVQVMDEEDVELRHANPSRKGPSQQCRWCSAVRLVGPGDFTLELPQRQRAGPGVLRHRIGPAMVSANVDTAIAGTTRCVSCDAAANRIEAALGREECLRFEMSIPLK